MENIIESVTVGNHENPIFFTTNPKVAEQYRVDSIVEETKIIAPDKAITVYLGILNGKVRVSAEAGNGITVYYKQ